ncbi:MAG: TolC family protein, partial [Gemmatimonadota bacterium]
MRRAAVLLAALSLGGPAVAGLRAQAVAVRTIEGQSVQAVRFWETLGDPILARLITQALSANPDLQAVEARVGGARAERFEAALDLAPAVTASGGYTRQRISASSFPGFDGRPPDQGLW